MRRVRRGLEIGLRESSPYSPAKECVRRKGDRMVLVIVATALATAGVTLGLAWIGYRLWGQRRVEAELARIQDEFERRVKAGVLAAGEELLPALREQVRLGFTDALRSSRAAGLAEGTAKVVADSADLLVDGLGNLFGLKKK